MASNTGARVSREDAGVNPDKVGHNSVTECQNSGTEGSISVTEKQNSGTEGSKSVPGKDNSCTEEQEFKWKSDKPESEWIRKLESRFFESRLLESRFKSPASHDESHRDLVVKLADFQRKPEEDYTPQQWRFGLHNRDLQTSTTLASATESEALKISLAAACNLSDRWDKFCDNVVDDPDKMVLKSYSLHPSNTTNYSKKEVQSLLTLDALTLVLVLSSLALPNPIGGKLMTDFMSRLEIGGCKIGALLKGGAAYGALTRDLFLCENQIPIVLLERVIRNLYFLLGKNSCSDIFRENPHEDGTKEHLHMILNHLVFNMCIDIFLMPCKDPDHEKDSKCISDQKIYSKFIDDHSHVGYFDDCAHIFACVYKILTASDSKESSPATKWCPHEDETKESASDPEKCLHSRSCLGDHSKVDIPGTSQNDFEQTGGCEHQTSTARKGNGGPRLRTVPLRSATDLKKAGLSIGTTAGMVPQVYFDKGCLYLPRIQLHDRTESYFRNLATYEVFDHYDDKRHAFTDYLHLMSDLIKTPEDVAYLIDDCNVIRNLLGTHKNAFQMWDRLQSGLLPLQYSNHYRQKIVNPINEHCNSTLNKTTTEFYNTFCSKPWLPISVITAAVLLIATLIQTYVAVIGSDKMQPHFPRGG